jgi:hypothetical protein
LSVQIGPHTLTRGEIYPKRYKSSTPGTARVAGDGSVSVTEGNYKDRVFWIIARLPRLEAMRIKHFIENNLRFHAEVTTIVDGYGVTRRARYWKDDVELVIERGDWARLELPFREEV